MLSTWNSSKHRSAASAGDVGRDLGDRLAGFLPPLLLDAIVDFEHEGMKMHPPFAPARCGGKEQIHQHRFAAPNRTAQIEPHRRVRAVVLGEAKAGEPAMPSRLGTVFEQCPIEALQSLDRQLLRRIGFEPPLLAQDAIGGHRPRRQRRGARATSLGGVGRGHRHRQRAAIMLVGSLWTGSGVAGRGRGIYFSRERRATRRGAQEGWR